MKCIVGFLLAVAGGVAVLPGEDYSGAMGVATTAIVSSSKERGMGVGGEVTANILLLNASVEVTQFSDAYKGHDVIAAAYVGVGALNPLMLQIGIDHDGFSGRVHGEVALFSLFSGDYGLYPSDKTRTAAFIRSDIILSYSLGVNEAGMFGGAGLGVLF